MAGRINQQTDTSQKESHDVENPEEGKKPERMFATDFTVYDPCGNEVHLLDYIGKAVVHKFCSGCWGFLLERDA